MKRAHLIISGDVQGVGFRAWVVREARELDLTGWVKNRENGAVEVVVEGQKADLEELVKLCQHGPEVAWVENVEVHWSESTGEFFRFEVVY